MANVLDGVLVEDVAELLLDEEWVKFDKAAIATIGERDGVTMYWVSGERERVTRGGVGSPDVPFTHIYTYPIEVLFDPAILSMADAIVVLIKLDDSTHEGYWEKETWVENGKVAVTLHLS